MKTENSKLATTPSYKSKKAFVLIALIAFPIAHLCCAFFIQRASGPYWLASNLDPSYVYLMNTLNVANYHRPHYTDHPGTPVITTGGVIIRAMNLGADEPTTARRVLGNPEPYIFAINALFVSLNAVCLLLAGWCIFAVSGCLLPAIIVQLTPFVSGTVQLGLLGYRPEPLLLSLSILVSGIAALTLKYDIEQMGRRFASAFGILIGIGIASKVSYAPVALLPLILFRSWKWRTWFIAMTGFTIILCLIPILTPGHLRNIYEFLFEVTTHTGKYGRGHTGFIDPGQFIRSSVTLVKTDPLFFAIFLGGIAVGVFGRTWLRLREPQWRLLAALSASQVVQFVLVAKHTESRYLIPAIGFIGLNFLLIVRFFTARIRDQRQGILAGLLMILGIVALSSFNLTHRVLAVRAREQREAVQRTADLSTKQKVVYYYTASSPAYAIRFGGIYSGNFYQEILSELYPNAYFYNLWTGEFSSFGGRIDIRELAQTTESFIISGYSLSDTYFKQFLPNPPLPDYVTLENIYRGDLNILGQTNGDAIYRATIRP